MDIAKVNKAIYAVIAVANFEKTLNLKAIVVMSKTSGSKCRLTVWDFEALKGWQALITGSVINWVRQASAAIPDTNYEIPETTQVDELQTFVGSKKKQSLALDSRE